MKDSNFVKLLKKYTTIDEIFINIFFNKFKIGDDLNFDIKDIDIAKYLEITLTTLRDRLSNKYSKNNNYIEKVDYIKLKTNKTSSITYMCNYKCFEQLAMTGDSKKSAKVRDYFSQLRIFMVENQDVIYQTMENKNILKKYVHFESIYFFVIDERKPDIIKAGRTYEIISRLRNYNVGRIKEINLKYFAIVKNSLLIEKCMKFKLKKNQVFDRKEIYKIEPKQLKKIINNCYCKHVSKKQNNELYEELAELLGLYAYTKNKIHMKPYIVIGKKL